MEPQHWQLWVYPEGLAPARRLAHYAILFDTIELNTTLYRLPSRAAVRPDSSSL